MNRDDPRDVTIQALRDRLSRLSEASLRINESLDFDTVLKEVVDSARALTDSRYGVITTLDGSGRPPDFVTSGISPDDRQALDEAPPEGLLVFEYLSGLERPLRVGDYRSLFSSVGLPDVLPMAVGPLLTAPIRHQRETVGNIYVGREETGRDFTREDEEVLVMFASQAALVIANARRYRDEQRARTDLQTLINTSPVGVAVLDARTGAPVSFNPEAVRILDGLRTPGRPPEHLLDVMTVVRADGRQVSLEEFSIAEALSWGETVRAEEIVMRVPDGRSVTTLVNATPIRSDDGQTESFVVTLQDLTQLHELERLRAEFLAMVSHELRTPLTSVKGSIATLLDPPTALGPTEMRQFFKIIDAQIDRMHVLISDLLDVARIETGTLAISPEPTDIATLIGEARNTFRSGGGRHRIDTDLERDLPWVMADRPRMIQVLANLLANAARNSPEKSPIQLAATREDLQVAVSISDEGSGIPAESLPHLFRKFSRIDTDNQRGDTGLGLAICKGIVEAHGGRIWADSDGPGLGAKFTFTIPTIEDAGYVSPLTAVPPPTPSSPQQTEEQTRVLAVDDDPQTLRYVQQALAKSGYTPIVTTDPTEAIPLMRDRNPDLVLLDLMLPGTDGIELMKQITATADLPVIFLSAYGQDQLVAGALDAGAADYIVKPFSPVELAARIRASLRRQHTPQPTQTYVLEDLTINYTERRVSVADQPVQLTAIEYRTLAELSANAGRVLTYRHLLRRVWGLDADADIRPMRTAISSLRRKLGDNAEDPTYIFTELRVGYRMPKANTPELPAP